MQLKPLPEGIERNIKRNVDGGHWIWLGAYHPDGQPLIGNRMAHSAVYRLSIEGGDVMSGRIFRTCGDRRCVNPLHMNHPRSDGRDAYQAVRRLPKEQDLPQREYDERFVKVLQRIADALEKIAENTTNNLPPTPTNNLPPTPIKT